MQEGPSLPPLTGVKTVLDGERYIEKVQPLDVDGAQLRLQSRNVGIHKVQSHSSVSPQRFCVQQTYSVECTAATNSVIEGLSFLLMSLQRGSGASIESESQIVDPETGEVGTLNGDHSMISSSVETCLNLCVNIVFWLGTRCTTSL